MEIREFQNERNKKLEEFHKTYTALQRDYSSKIQAAIGEPDTTKRQELVSKVLSINSELSNAVRGFLSEIYAGSQAVPTKTMEQLTADLIAYQRQYTLIEKGKDRVETLKLINKANQDRLSNVTLEYNIYMGALMFLVFVVGFLVIRTNFKTAYRTFQTTTKVIGGRIFPS